MMLAGLQAVTSGGTRDEGTLKVPFERQRHRAGHEREGRSNSPRSPWCLYPVGTCSAGNAAPCLHSPTAGTRQALW